MGLDTLKTLCNEDFCFGSKGFADYGDNAKAVFFLKKHDSLGRLDSAQETPTVLGEFNPKEADERI